VEHRQTYEKEELSDHMRDHLRRPWRVLRQLGVVLLLFAVQRWIFFGAYREQFPVLNGSSLFWAVLQGLRFDAMTVVVANALWIVLELLPFPWRSRKAWTTGMRFLFLAVNIVLLLICCIDLAYFGFNGKRLTADILGQTGAGLRELPSMLLNYWWTALIFLLALFVLLRSTRHRNDALAPRPFRDLLVALPFLGLLVLVARGGWQYQGLSPAHANDHVGPAWASLVTNSAFTFGYSLSEPPLHQRYALEASTLDRLAPLRYSLPGPLNAARPNVVVLIVESMGREYLGSLNNGKGYFPFVDSLAARSLVFANGFANAERSNKSICAILGGIPSFTDDAFMNTAFAGNTVEGLGTRMKEIGYATAFFHGGLNGEYKFDSFTRACGFDRYYGKDEFGDETYFDGHWGVYDEEFLQWSADRLKELPQPFCAAAFTLSSHDPFVIPERYHGVFPSGGQDIHESLGYTDMAIRRFFEKASREPWFANTIFVITGDHTYLYNEHPKWYRNPAGRFAVPIVVYAPDGRLAGRDEHTAQHLDIVPTVLDLVGYSGEINTFGQSLMRQDRPAHAVIQLGGQYSLIEDDRILLFDGERPTALYDHRTDTLCAKDLRMSEPERTAHMTQVLKAQIERHAQVMLGNGLVAK